MNYGMKYTICSSSIGIRKYSFINTRVLQIRDRYIKHKRYNGIHAVNMSRTQTIEKSVTISGSWQYTFQTVKKE